jgi:hypothetical protein
MADAPPTDRAHSELEDWIERAHAAEAKVAALEQELADWKRIVASASDLDAGWICNNCARLREAIQRWANAVGERERFDAESELLRLTEGEK